MDQNNNQNALCATFLRALLTLGENEFIEHTQLSLTYLIEASEVVDESSSCSGTEAPTVANQKFTVELTHNLLIAV